MKILQKLSILQAETNLTCIKQRWNKWFLQVYWSAFCLRSKSIYFFLVLLAKKHFFSTPLTKIEITISNSASLVQTLCRLWSSLVWKQKLLIRTITQFCSIFLLTRKLRNRMDASRQKVDFVFFNFSYTKMAGKESLWRTESLNFCTEAQDSKNGSNCCWRFYF